MNENVTVHVVDDDDSICSAVSRLLKSAGFQARGYASAQELLASAVGKEDASDIVLTDLRMPGIDGMSLAERLSAARFPPPVVFLSAHGQVCDGVRAMKEGAVDFLEKPLGAHELVAAVGRALERMYAERAKRHEIAELRQRHASVTPREHEVFVLVVSGLLNKEVAWELGISEKTVKVHRARVVKKMGAQSLPELVRMAERLGIPVDPRAKRPTAVAL
jgi:FixJ family two-component response regulator